MSKFASRKADSGVAPMRTVGDSTPHRMVAFVLNQLPSISLDSMFRSKYLVGSERDML